MGDTHGLKPVFLLIENNKIENNNIIHVGDLGLGFEKIVYDVKNLLLLDEMLIETNNKLYVIRGNHDNPMFWGIPAGLNLPEFHNLVLVPDHTVLEIEGKKIYFAGGAISIDRSVRKTDKPSTWWKSEEYVPNLSIDITIYQDIDIVVTHSAPDFVKPITSNVHIVNQWHNVENLHGKNLKLELSVERALIANLYSTIVRYSTPKLWFYGHFHKSYKTEYSNTEFIGLNINQLKEII